jgi:hypothetical protein
MPLELSCARAHQWLNPLRQKEEPPPMRAETEKLIADIKQSLGLLRRHL